MPVSVRCHSHHFAPSVETVRLSHVVAPPRPVVAYRVDVTDRGDVPVYRRDWAAGDPDEWTWDGEDNLAAPLAGVARQYVTPLRSPYRVRLTVRVAGEPPLRPRPPQFAADDGVCLPCGEPAAPASDADSPPEELSAVATVYVLYRELRLRRMTWLAAYTAVTGRGEAFPAGGSEADVKKWLCYRLNELGYPAGPITDPPDAAPIARALFHYTQSHPELPRVNRFATFDAEGGGWDWHDLWSGLFGSLDDLCSDDETATGERLLTALKGREQPRSDTFESPAAFDQPTTPTRALLDGDVFYINKDFQKTDAHADYDEQLHNPLCVPLVGELLLVSQSDADGTGPGVAAPLAVGPAPLEWLAFDPPEDLSVVPPPSLRGNIQSRARAYLHDAREALAAAPDDLFDSQDNCPRERGGLRDPGRGMRVHFRRVDNLGGAPDDGATRGYLTAADDDRKNPRGCLGLAAAWFHGSYIGGDNYTLAARLHLDAALQADHRQLPGLARCFEPVATWLTEDPPDPLSRRTGKITVWRRHHVLREILWGAEDLPPIHWNTVVNNFRAAHVELVPPSEAPVAVADLFDEATRARLIHAIVTSAGPANNARRQFEERAGEARFNPAAMYPLPYLTLAEYERSNLHINANDAFDGYQKFYLADQASSWLNYRSMIELSCELRAAFDALGYGAGLIVLRVRYMPPADFAALLPPAVLAANRDACAAFVFKKAIATGMDYGVVCLDTNNAKNFTDGYFVSHEINHCLFGSHAFEEKSLADHDRSDANCIMYYNSNNDGIRAGWAVRSPPERYDFTLSAQIPNAEEQGALVGKIVPRRADYTVSGTLAEVQEILRALRYVPPRDGSPEAQLRITLDTVASCPRPQVGGRTLPYVKLTKAGKKAATPLRDITLEAPDLRGNEPRFCGKCLLKLRGWRLDGAAAAAADAPVLPEKTRCVPVRPVMSFENYAISEGRYRAIDEDGQETDVPLGVGTKDPLDRKLPLGPYRFEHRHKLTWSSSNGQLKALTGVLTREYVKFRGDTQAPPFSGYADPDREYYQFGTAAQFGESFDDHSMPLPSLACGWPLTEGTLIGEQWYQYSFDSVTWHNIEGAAYLLVKRVYQTPKGWVLQFRKTNWPEHNPVPFEFDVRYRIGPQPLSKPKLGLYVPHDNAMFTILAAGKFTAFRSATGHPRAVSLAELAPWLAPKPWP